MTRGTGSIAGIDVSFDPSGYGEILGELDARSSSAHSIRIRIRPVDSIDAPSVPRDAFYGPVSAWCRGPTWTFVGEHTRVDASGDAIEVCHRGDAPERLALELGVHAALASSGRHHLHAAVLRSPSGEIVLIAGPSGAGKSTVCLALGQLGWDIGGDDIAYVDHERRVWPLRREVRASARTLSLFPELTARRADEGKMLVDVRRCPMDGVPGALLFPTIGSCERSHTHSMTQVDVFPRLLLGSAFAALPSQEGTRRALAGIAAHVPAAAMVLGRDLLDDPAAVMSSLVAACRS